jgi:hypothetical protein
MGDNSLLAVLGGVLALTNIVQVGVVVNMAMKLGKVCDKVEKHDEKLGKIEAACPLCPKER